MAYSLKVILDTWLKLSTEQGSRLADDQKQYINAGTVLPITAFTAIGADHIKVTLGLDPQGRQLFFKGRNTWFVYRPSVQLLHDGQVTNISNLSQPQPSAYFLKIVLDTWLKLTTDQSSRLSSEQKQFMDAGKVLPIASYEAVQQDHLKVTFGRDAQGQQIAFKNRNTWFVYRPTVQLLRDGQVIAIATSQTGDAGQINTKGLRLIKSFEGLRLDAYLDDVGVWTIGYGTTTGVRPGMRITESQAEDFLKRDVDRFERSVADLVQVPLNQDQFSALVSFTYNVGDGALSSSTLLRLLNRGDYQGAADQLLRWNRGDNGELPGLTRRRKAERALFMGQDFTAFL